MCNPSTACVKIHNTPNESDQRFMTSFPTETFPLWTDAAPGALGTDAGRDVPTLTPFGPLKENAQGAAMIICPGGGYGKLADHEGADYALWLSEQGIACFVLKYRLGSHGYRHPSMHNDVSRAVRTVRANAAAWGVDPERIGVMGSSAGGHLTSTAVTLYDAGDVNAADNIDRVSSRPNLGVLCYPVISMGIVRHEGSKTNLLGDNPSPELLELLSAELQVTSDTPPCFIWHTQDDAGVKVENALEFAAALQRNGVQLDLHVYQHGRHGLGLGLVGYKPGETQASEMHPWTGNLLYWLREQAFIA